MDINKGKPKTRRAKAPTDKKMKPKSRVVAPKEPTMSAPALTGRRVDQFFEASGNLRPHRTPPTPLRTITSRMDVSDVKHDSLSIDGRLRMARPTEINKRISDRAQASIFSQTLRKR